MITKMDSQEVTGDEVEEMPIRGEEARTVRLNKQLPKITKKALSELFHEFEDVFAWDHTELKGIDPKLCEHKIPLKVDARPIRMQRY